MSPQEQQAKQIVVDWLSKHAPIIDHAPQDGDIDKLVKALSALQGVVEKKDDDLMYAFTIIANAHGGDWDKASPEWKRAAMKFRDECINKLANRHDAPTESAARASLAQQEKQS